MAPTCADRPALAALVAVVHLAVGVEGIVPIDEPSRALRTHEQRQQVGQVWHHLVVGQGVQGVYRDCCRFILVAGAVGLHGCGAELSSPIDYGEFFHAVVELGPV